MDSTLIGVSKNIQRIQALIDQVADTGLNTVVYGETGVGKELVVQNLYRKSDRVNKPFVKVNCAALPDTLLESEMFGYEGGDFTPLGSEKLVKMGAWVITATNHDLEKDMQAGNFREDLYYRLSTIKIYVAPLRSRPEDIPHLIEHYVRLYVNQFSGKQLLTPSPEAIDKMTGYHWPGNVRELQNVLKRLMILADGEDTLDELIAVSRLTDLVGAEQGAPRTSSVSSDLLDLSKIDLGSLSLKKIKKKAMDRVEKEVIAFVLDKTGWNRSKATKILKISYKTLLYKIKDLGIEPPQESGH